MKQCQTYINSFQKNISAEWGCWGRRQSTNGIQALRQRQGRIHHESRNGEAIEKSHERASRKGNIDKTTFEHPINYSS